jgi:Polyketide cyclase / dehydrase and lipid transport
MHFQESILVSVPSKKVFGIYADIGTWPTWDKEVESASINGGFALGSTGKIKPKGAPESIITVTELTPNQSFTIECSLPLCKMHFIHHLNAAGPDSTNVINELKFTGLLAPVFGRLIGKGIYKTVPATLQGLKAHAEAMA